MQTLFLWILTAAMLAVFPASAQDYPNRPIRFVQPYPPGGSSDILARPIAMELGRILGQPVVLDFKPGGGSSIGTDNVAKATPDGYTLGMLLPAFTINATLMPKLTYDAVRDFAPVTMVATLPLVMVVHADSDIRTLQDLMKAARHRPGGLNFASAGSGNTTHLAMELFRSMAGLDMVHVSYRGSGPAITGMLSKEVDVMVDSLSSSLPHIQSGKFRALAVTTAARSSLLPNVPTVKEAGGPDFNVSTWYGIFAPAATSPAVLRQLNAAFVKVLNTPETRARLEERGYQIVGSSAVELDAHVKSEIERWAKVIRDTGTKLE